MCLFSVDKYLEVSLLKVTPHVSSADSHIILLVKYPAILWKTGETHSYCWVSVTVLREDLPAKHEDLISKRLQCLPGL